MTKYNWTRVNSDVDGNPRFVIHFLNLLTDEEKRDISPLQMVNNSMSLRYAIACKRANKIGGRKYHTKQYGGGIVFSAYSLEDTEQSIDQLKQQAEEQQKRG